MLRKPPIKLPYSDPDPAGIERATKAKQLRDLATETARLRPHALTRANSEETDHSDKFPSNFTKGLKHDGDGLIECSRDYACFVEAINAPDRTLFDKSVPTAETHKVSYNCTIDGKEPEWRGWESPRAGHVYELQGPDAGAVGMAPAPRVGSSELSAEMAEVYGLAILRDVPFSVIAKGGAERLCPSKKKSGKALLSAEKIVHLINGMRYYSLDKPISSTPHNVDCNGLNWFERNRRFARTQSVDGLLTPANAFRGSTKGALVGPYISQFMLIGATSRACSEGAASSFRGTSAKYGLADGFIPYGSIVIDQRTQSHKNCLDYMTDWGAWLDVQNGARMNGTDQFEPKRRFITTPRDLATYVHYDALYEAYLNAALILDAIQAPRSKGFPEPSPTGRRDAFATFGGPHILSLVTEVATRCLKAVRRQKFNYHRRARPEVMGARLTLACLKQSSRIGCAGPMFDAMLAEIPNDLRKAVIEHNKAQKEKERSFKCDPVCPPAISGKKFGDCNLLLPMAFPEGSPMHPAYGAGHATVAGGCVTMLKAFFEMFEDCDSFKERELRVDAGGKYCATGKPVVYEADNNGDALKDVGANLKKSENIEALTIQGELDKLAANISIGRNMAGVHYYSDYYDSLRMGERIAVGILMEQAPTYVDYMEMTFKSYDGDYVTISGEGGSAASISIMNRDGLPVSPSDWWLRHVNGQEMHVDL